MPSLVTSTNRVDFINLTYAPKDLLIGSWQGNITNDALYDELDAFVESIEGTVRLNKFPVTVKSSSGRFEAVIDHPVHGQTMFCRTSGLGDSNRITMHYIINNADVQYGIDSYRHGVLLQDGISSYIAMQFRKSAVDRQAQLSSSNSGLLVDLNNRSAQLEEQITRLREMDITTAVSPHVAFIVKDNVMYVQNDFVPPLVAGIIPSIKSSAMTQSLAEMAAPLFSYLDDIESILIQAADHDLVDRALVDEKMTSWRSKSRINSSFSTDGIWFKVDDSESTWQLTDSEVIRALRESAMDIMQILSAAVSIARRARPVENAGAVISSLVGPLTQIQSTAMVSSLGRPSAIPSFIHDDFDPKYFHLLVTNVLTVYEGSGSLLSRLDPGTIGESKFALWMDSWTNVELGDIPDITDPADELYCTARDLRELVGRSATVRGAYASAFHALSRAGVWMSVAAASRVVVKMGAIHTTMAPRVLGSLSNTFSIGRKSKVVV